MPLARLTAPRVAVAAATAASRSMARVENLEPRLLMHEGHEHLPTDPVEPVPAPVPHADNPTLHAEHMALMNLVPHDAATHVAVISGNWSDPATWQDGLLPDLNANVLVGAGVTLTVDAVNETPLHWLRADGVLRFAPDRDTGLVVDTIVIAPGGAFEMGTAATPIAPDAMAKVIFAGGDIDTAWDPRLLSRGLVSHGSVSIFGSHVTSFVPLSGDALKGTTTLEVTADPAGWKVGDRLILTGTSAWNTEDDEQLSILAIDGRRVTVEALKFDHVVAAGSGGGVYLANVSRNAVLESADPATVARRGHVMFMHSDKVRVESAGFYGLGRTDKRNAFDDPRLDEATGAFTPGYGTNPRGRYAVHFHRTGLARVDQPAVIRGSAVVDSPGWGFVNHSSNVVMEDNVAYDVIGAAFTTEAGDEIGAFRRNLAVKGTGSGAGIESRKDVQDFGHQGDGFWFQGAGVEVVGNVAVGQKHAGFVYFTQGLEEAGLGQRQFLASSLADPSIAGGAERVAVADVPIRLFADNEAFASGGGFESWFHMLHANHAAPSVVQGFRAWNNGGKAMFTPYTNRLVVKDSVLTGNLAKPSSTGIGGNDVTKNITYRDNTIAGFKVGIDAPRNGQSFVTGGVFNNVTNIQVTTANERGRSLDIGGGVVFHSPGDAALAAAGAEAHYDISLRSNFDPKHQDITRLFNPDVIKLGTVKYNGVQLYYNEQAADFVPFVKGEAAPYVPRCLVGKTNAQLWAQYGIAVGGTVAPRDAVRDPLINAMIGAPATYLPKLSLSSAKYTNNVTGYVLGYRDEAGNRVQEARVTRLREGWNVLVRRIGGVNRSFFVFGDTTTATFELAPDQSLALNPADLKTGFTLRGSVVDNSFGRMNFKRRFKDLDQLPLQTDADGVTKFITVAFPIRDFAGNTVTVQLKVIVDPTAPLQKDIGRRNLPRKPVSGTLVALLGFRDRDAA